MPMHNVKTSTPIPDVVPVSMIAATGLKTATGNPESAQWAASLPITAGNSGRAWISNCSRVSVIVVAPEDPFHGQHVGEQPRAPK